MQVMDGPRTGLHVPRWAIASLFAALAIFGAGYATAQKLDARIDARIANTIGPRLCRLETALGLAPWPDCRR